MTVNKVEQKIKTLTTAYLTKNKFSQHNEISRSFYYLSTYFVVQLLHTYLLTYSADKYVKFYLIVTNINFVGL